MHDRGYVHRDIKPGNFVLGYHSLPPVARFVYIIDFGLARYTVVGDWRVYRIPFRAFAYPPPKGAPAGSRWLSRRARATLDFKGTWRFASPAMHEEKEQVLSSIRRPFGNLTIQTHAGPERRHLVVSLHADRPLLRAALGRSGRQEGVMWCSAVDV